MQANKKTYPFALSIYLAKQKSSFLVQGEIWYRCLTEIQTLSKNVPHKLPSLLFILPCMPCPSAQRSVKYSNKSTFFKTMRFLCLSFQLKYKSSLIHAGILYFFISIISSCHGQFYRRQVVIHFHCFSSYSTHLYLYFYSPTGRSQAR